MRLGGAILLLSAQACSGTGVVEPGPPGLDPPPASRDADPSRDAVGSGELVERRLVVAEVAGRPVYAADIYPLLYLTAHEATQEAVRQLVVRELVARENQRIGFEVPEAELEEEVRRSLEEDEQQVRKLTRGELGLEEYVPLAFGIRVESYRSWVRETVRTRLMMSRLARFELYRHPRIQVRVIRVSRADLADEIHEKLSRGADFTVLARAHSEDAAAAEGGLYPPLPRDLGYPLLASLEDLGDGELDRVREIETEQGTAYRIAQVVSRQPAFAGSDPELLQEIEALEDARVISSLELDAWMRIMEKRYQVQVHGISDPDG